MSDELTHRGPDDAGYFVAPGIELGMRRLAVIDIAHGKQPVAVGNGSIQVVFNGEIYNYRELRVLLEGHGDRFTTDSDTEVIARGFLRFGADIVHRLVGMFAIAVWDARSRTLTLMRDRLGKKPIVYGRLDDGGLAFASEARAIIGTDWPRRPDFNAINSVLAVGYAPLDATAYEGLASVPPAHILTWSDGAVDVRRYWQPDFSSKLRIEAPAAQELALATIDEAVRARLISERPLGAFLSGGYDSTVVTAIMAQHSASPVKTFTVAFSDSRFDESHHAQQVADYLGTDHHCLRVDPDPSFVADRLPEIFDQPFADSSAIPTLMLSEYARSEVVVALGGDGGDEAFGGYERYRLAPMLQKFNPLLRPFASFRAPLSAAADKAANRRASRLARLLRTYPNLMQRYVGFMMWADASEREQLWDQQVVRDLDMNRPERILESSWRARRATNDVDRMIATDLVSYLPGDLLVKADISSMAHSLELRSPLLDHRVIELGASLPADLKVTTRATKIVLKDIARRLVPPELIDRPKMGFGIPRAAWVRGPLRPLIRDTLSPSSIRRRGWFDSRRIENLLNEHDRGLDRDSVIWPLLMTELWAQRWLD